MLIVSLNTELYNTALNISNSGNWGMLKWISGQDVSNKKVTPILNVFSVSNVLVADQQLQNLLPKGNYYRLDPTIPFSEAKTDGTDAPLY